MFNRVFKGIVGGIVGILMVSGVAFGFDPSYISVEKLLNKCFDGTDTIKATISGSADFDRITADSVDTKTLTADTITVDQTAFWGGGRTHYADLATDLDALIASSRVSAGDTIKLASGTYAITDDIDVTKGINIVGQGIGKTTITCATASKNIFASTVSNVRIANMTISHTGATPLSCISFDGIAGAVLTGCIIENCDISQTIASSSNRTVLFNDASGTVRNCIINGTSSNGYEVGLEIVGGSTCEAAITLNVYDSVLTASGTVTAAWGVQAHSNDSPSAVTCNLYNTKCVGTGSGGNRYGIYSRRTTSGTVSVNAYGCVADGTTYDGIADASASITLYDTTLVNNTTSGTITYGGTVVTSGITGSVLINGSTYSVQKQHDEIGTLLDCLTAPKAIVGFTGTGATTTTETGYESGAGRTWTYSGGLATDKIFQGSTYVYSFDGVDSYLSTPDTADMSFGDGSDDVAYSIGGWVQVANTAVINTVFSKWDETTGAELREYYCVIDSAEKFTVYQYDESANAYGKLVVNSAIAAGWHCIVFTNSGIGGATCMATGLIYVDGVAVASTASYGGTYDSMENTATLPCIGAYEGAGGTMSDFFSQDMGRPWVTAEALSAATVWKYYESTRGYYNK